MKLANFPLTSHVFINVHCPPLRWTMWLTARLGALSRLGKRKQSWTLSWFHGSLLYGDLLFSSASHFQSSQPPSYPAKLPSPNNRLKAIQLSPLYSMHFIFSLSCTWSLTASTSGRLRREAVEVIFFFGRGGGHIGREVLLMSCPRV